MEHIAAITPSRINAGDDQLEILRFAANAVQTQGAVLATLVDVRGGAARALGAHMAVAANGQFCGYVSGGCVEAAVASEALASMMSGKDRTVVFGEGSPFFDIVLPCGGGITVSIHILRQAEPLVRAIEWLESRKACGLDYSRLDETITFVEQPNRLSGFRDGTMHTVYRPRTRLVISGQMGEAQVLQRLADAAGYDVILIADGSKLSRL
ncbi:XdhC family protein [Agrobacterium tumefaciens]|uniref:XdhC family protein n=1 Tax=Agrobacterium tumefaciens TaxID=358 RepID=UPI0030137199